jgi:hypothetical protein
MLTEYDGYARCWGAAVFLCEVCRVPLCERHKVCPQCDSDDVIPITQIEEE